MATSRHIALHLIQRPVPAFLLFFVLGGLIYANTLHSSFIYDDIPNIIKNQHIRITNITPAAIRHIVEGPGASASRPLAMFTFALNYFFHRYQTAGYHLVNITIHLITTFLIFLITAHTLRLCRIASPLAPLFTSLLWLAHPLHIQSVTYIVQRMTSLATMFYLLALFCFIKGRIRLCEQKKWFGTTYLCFLTSAVSGLMALLCKPIAGTLPLTIFFYEWYFFHNLELDWIKRRSRWVILSVLLFITIAATYLWLISLEQSLALYQSQHFLPTQRILSELPVMIYYISLLIYPHPARLNLDYDFPQSISLMQPGTTAISLGALSLLVAAVIIATPKHRISSFAILWFLINLAIESALMGLALIYEHRTYLPSIFPVMAATLFLLETPKPRSVTIGLLCLIVTVAGLWTFRRNMVWRTNLSLWRDCVSKSPHKAGPHNNLGLAYLRQGKYFQAIQHHQIALNIRLRLPGGATHPDTAASYTNLGCVCRHVGNSAKAISCHKKALLIRKKTLGPQHLKTAECYNNLAVACKNHGIYDQAIQYYNRALAIIRDQTGAESANTAAIYNNLGTVYYKMNRYQSAFNHLKKALLIYRKYYGRNHPQTLAVHQNLLNMIQQTPPQKLISNYTP